MFEEVADGDMRCSYVVLSPCAEASSSTMSALLSTVSLSCLYQSGKDMKTGE